MLINGISIPLYFILLPSFHNKQGKPCFLPLLRFAMIFIFVSFVGMLCFSPKRLLYGGQDLAVVISEDLHLDAEVVI